MSLNLYWFLAFVVIGGAFMVNAFLAPGATKQFSISFFGIGPTEVRVGLVFLHIAFIVFGEKFFMHVAPFFAGLLVFVLGVVVYNTQRQLWITDKKQAR